MLKLSAIFGSVCAAGAMAAAPAVNNEYCTDLKSTVTQNGKVAQTGQFHTCVDRKKTRWMQAMPNPRNPDEYASMRIYNGTVVFNVLYEDGKPKECTAVNAPPMPNPDAV